MNGFTRYVFGQLFIGMILVTIGLTCIIWLSQSLRFVELIVNRGVGAGTFVYLTLLMLPSFLTVIIPISLFCVVVFVYSKMIADRELVVMRAAGVSQFALGKPALVLALITVVIGYLLNLYFLPHSYRLFREMQWDIRYNYSHVLLREGTFTNINNATTLYVRERTPDGQLLGILVHDQRDEHKPFTLMAARGALVESNGNTQVVMFQGNRQAVDANTNQWSILYFDRYTFDLGKRGGLNAERHREPRERQIDELFNIRQINDVDPRDFGKYTVEGHKRLSTPIMALTLTVLALASLITGSFSRRTQSKRIIVSVFLMISLQATSLGLENIAAKNPAFIPFIYVNSIVPLLIAFWFMHLSDIGRLFRRRVVAA
ncbi:MAG: LPS export ABC transporter permease LptF [Rhodospirillaceae bacterium TMED8]|nr:LPS export ABC transporter permease LptF [Magnetovibrio sp.]OUT50849.1 MAG: LPS export ABC transporter permease LptF [Rhodospirillaceae bacterium TMED8]|tara:strand:- start:749 stop:1867 length:1119 start_codon:yes stop_codon:yes gene_type:complete